MNLCNYGFNPIDKEQINALIKITLHILKDNQDNNSYPHECP